ncbi:MAG: hypothetical protein QXT43_00540 [Candidatus Micrarchaeaceae archaeon]
MAKESSEKLKKKLEALKRLQQASQIVEEGGIQSQVVLTSADDQMPSADAHVRELLERSEIKSPAEKAREIERSELAMATPARKSKAKKSANKDKKAKAGKARTGKGKNKRR